ncbi:uncharacterized protein LOC144556652 [Carex rostrata]
MALDISNFHHRPPRPNLPLFLTQNLKRERRDPLQPRPSLPLFLTRKPKAREGGALLSSSSGSNTAAFFFTATLFLWAASIAFVITFNGRCELMVITIGFFFFQTANFVIRRFISEDPLLVNTSVSLLHSPLISATVVYILVNQWIMKVLREMFTHEELVTGTLYGAHWALCFSCGYFAYDQLDMLLYRLYSGFIPAILLHHLILLVCFTLALYKDVTINYLILSLVCELHSIFLHTRKVRRMAGVRDVNSPLV